jgi:hypothetical protein
VRPGQCRRRVAEYHRIWEAGQLAEGMSDISRRMLESRRGCAVPKDRCRRNGDALGDMGRKTIDNLLTFVLQAIFHRLAALGPADETTRMTKRLDREEALTIPRCQLYNQQSVPLHASEILTALSTSLKSQIWPSVCSLSPERPKNSTALSPVRMLSLSPDCRNS